MERNLSFKILLMKEKSQWLQDIYHICQTDWHSVTRLVFFFFYLTWEGYKWAYLLIVCNNLTNVWSQHYNILFYSFTIRNFVYMRCRRKTITADWRFKYIILADKIIVLLQRENIKTKFVFVGTINEYRYCVG